MISHEHPWASVFLLVVGGFFLLLVSLPLLLAPLRWARLFLWELPTGRNDLTVYLGRCLGGVSSAVIAVFLQGVPHPEAHPMAFETIAAIAAVMTVVHVHGAIRRIQPWTETAEIALYAIVGSLAVWVRLSLG